MNPFITNVLAISVAQMLADSLKTKIATVFDWLGEQLVVSLKIKE